MDKSEIEGLFKKYKKGECNEDEIRLLQEWLTHGTFDSFEISHEEVLEDLKLVEDSLPLRHSKVPYVLYRRIAGYAASIIHILGIAYYYYRPDVSSSAVSYESLAALEPGSNTAVLQLDDGSSITLDTLTQDRLVEIDGALVRLNASGQLIYLAGQS